MSDKTEAELLKEQLFIKREHGSKCVDEPTLTKVDEFADSYKKFLDTAKTEREFVIHAIEQASSLGFTEYDSSKQYNAGDKVYINNRRKAVILAVIGKAPAEAGVRIAAAHIDSPRLDLKPNPLYEADEMAFLKTHYYGGIKKYQWMSIPLALHGVIFRKDGVSISINIGEDEGDPQFCIPDLLPHLATEQMKKPVSSAFTGEGLNVLIGSREFKSEKGAELVKLNVLKLLYDKYGIIEEDFLSAELELVPAGKAVDIGLDHSMIGAYGHDDRVCAYPALQAIAELAEAPEYTCISVLADKEEVGSMGNTGLQSAYLRDFIYDLAEAQGGSGSKALAKSACLSADVNAAYDPNFADVFEKRNAAYINHGICVTKYTGSRGKGGTSDASAEFMFRIRTLFDEDDILWQTGELGKVDAGGGGTVAQYVANLNVDVVDIGVPVLSMHAPFEIVSKIDLYMTYQGISSFFRAR
ncbi:MAG: aminopeptidase [Oscillospiraceae bacterium]|jgi:aspartyl aminopeptidase|nr:aminopeptidase [Oscillospiraceae bacterium]